MNSIEERAGRRRDTGPAETNRLITEIGARHHFIVTRAELIDAGLSDQAIANRLRSRFLTRIHRGVYSLVPLPLSRPAALTAAVLACGNDAVLSHRSAAHLWGLLDESSSLIHVARLSGSKRVPRGVRLHRPRSLATWERAIVNRIPVTSVARTLADLAVLSSDRVLNDAVSGARRVGRFDPVAIQRVVADAPGRPGGVRLLELVDRWAPIETQSISPFQDRLFNVCEEAGLPRPEQEVPIGPYRVDFLWREQRLILEADGRLYHETRFDEDRARDLYLASRGYQTIRVTYRMLTDNPERVVSQIRKTLAHASAR